MKLLAGELKIPEKVVLETFVKHCPEEIHPRKSTPAYNATYELLSNWMNKEHSRKVAYEKLGDALIRVGLKLVAQEILGHFPAKQQEMKPGVKRKNQNGKKDQRKKQK